MTTDKPTFEQTQQTVIDFIKARKWHKTNTSRGLAISLSLEANELLEYYQWQDESFGNKQDIESELADIFIYAIQFADKNEIDITAAVLRKLDKMGKKYPVEIFETEDKAERNKAWLEAKQGYEKDTTL